MWGRDRYDARWVWPRTREPYLTAGLALNGSAVVEVGAGVGLGVDVSAYVNPEVSPNVYSSPAELDRLGDALAAVTAP